MAAENDTEGGNTGPSTAPSAEQPFSQELLAQIRQLKAQKAELEASLGQQRENAHVREQELLDEVASARDATSHAQQQSEAVDQQRAALEEVLACSPVPVCCGCVTCPNRCVRWVIEHQQ